MDEDVLKEEVPRGVHGERPELALHEAHAPHREIGRVADDEVDGPPGHVAGPVGKVVPACRCYLSVRDSGGGEVRVRVSVLRAYHICPFPSNVPYPCPVQKTSSPPKSQATLWF